MIKDTFDYNDFTFELPAGLEYIPVTFIDR